MPDYLSNLLVRLKSTDAGVLLDLGQEGNDVSLSPLWSVDNLHYLTAGYNELIRIATPKILGVAIQSNTIVTTKQVGTNIFRVRIYG